MLLFVTLLKIDGWEFEELAMISFGLALATLFASIGARFTRTKLNSESCDDAVQKARELLAMLKGRQFHSESEIIPLRISDLIEQVRDRPTRAKCMALLKQIYRHAAVCQLDQTYGAIDGRALDWHQYDLCIIVPDEHRGLAIEIKARLLRKDRWRVLLCNELNYPLEERLQVELLTEVFYSSSWKCLALVSAETDNETLRKWELSYASQRNQIEGVLCSGYLILVALDEAGLSFIKEDPFLRESKLVPVEHLLDEVTGALTMLSNNAK